MESTIFNAHAKHIKWIFFKLNLRAILLRFPPQDETYKLDFTFYSNNNKKSFIERVVVR